MQTFLPYKDFTQSLSQLDNKRLGKQRVETKYILDLLMQRTDKKGYANHPIVHMWKANLLKKDKRYYSKFDWGKVNDIPYVWLDPSKDQWFYINPTSKKRNYININRGT